MTYFVTYFLYTENVHEAGIELVEQFAYFPTLRDINEVGDILCAKHQMFDFQASRGRMVRGKWTLNDADYGVVV